MENETEIRVLDEVGSTNDEALSLGRAGAAHGLAVAARRQTAGRGRRGHAWDSPAGNLYLSVVLRPNVGPERLSGLAAVCGLGALEALSALGATGVLLKWPNDLLARGRKVSGILVEAARDTHGETFAACGIGVNVERAPRGLGATCLEELGVQVALLALAQGLRARLCERCDAWAASIRALVEKDGPLTPVLDDYLAHLAWLGESVVALSPTGDALCTGRLATIDAWGRAVLETPHGTRAFSAEQASLRPLA